LLDMCEPHWMCWFHIASAPLPQASIEKIKPQLIWPMCKRLMRTVEFGNQSQRQISSVAPQ
jgi:hypothetical protein